MKKLQIEDDHRCFVCGMDNPDGLRLKWTVDGLTTTAQFIPDQKYQGWKGVLHGGIIATLLDEAMTRLVCVTLGNAVTAEMTVRFVAPARIGDLLSICGEITKERGKIIEMKASVHSGESLIAHSTGKAIKI
jgi:uncharacterized protein (TIGR00369 family)